ncbi:hypothetical protein EPJ67_06415 [Brachyspira aalborgi]|uniref:Uncharacterized protein n=1 Tax=Brachyspira aalborgi TaxID=29522 RepID=A0A5C8G3C5_9SPIR|nr:hypothetical protein EPJ67_06415 [Brachyspira aalborgi]
MVKPIYFEIRLISAPSFLCLWLLRVPFFKSFQLSFFILLQVLLFLSLLFFLSQAFGYRIYMVAMERYINDFNYKKRLGKKIVTDDAEIYSAYAGKVGIVECSSNNIKITNKEDLNFFLNLL